MKADDDSAHVTFPPPFVYLGFLMIGLAADRAIGQPLGLPPLTRGVLAIALIVPGAGLLLAASGLFRRAGTDVKPWKTATALVDSGVYRFTRNPMYLGMALLYAGLGFAFASAGALLLLPVVIIVIQTQVIAREERYLETKFGDAYRAYRQRVRRWM
ncbi:isoprenylcysteine carboxylmethyltransferase family protein [Sphingobium sp. DEHP117]|uniref:methyltransferase family protein n=1 Tax=Sphingobium sp. DEHP117 TaxID=2993436 RepID=UPI0027D55D99|nr:methyltransferase [Sphingobium sp. DEHP117]MDQ4421311.1 isoprenylcysteine carboxylmethyltransferase family protein [Sphingobium sp. DEHP117]